VARERLLHVVFFLSGVSALTYQVAWQRLLFGAFGVDVESITIIVSTFMLGLGCGALAGGQLADRYGRRLLALFAACELGIGAFGCLSPWLIPAVGDYSYSFGLFGIALANFLLILAPASLMGATLPMLVSYLFRGNRNVGISIGGLYLSNTLGAGLGAIAAGLILFTFLTLDEAIYAAACGNFIVSTIVIFGVRRRVAT
jgi:MFS family permease